MKKLLYPSIIAALLLVQSCFKTEVLEVKCTPALTKPVLSLADTITRSLGQTLSLSVTSNAYATTYTWTGPNGLRREQAGNAYSLVITSEQQQGLYIVQASNDEVGCTSPTDSVYVKVTVTEPQCGVTDNMYTVGGSNALTTVNPGTATAVGSYYAATWNVSGTRKLKVNFGSAPGSSPKMYVINQNTTPDALGDNEAQIVDQFGTSVSTYFMATGGGVYVVYENGSYRVKFCNIPMYSSYYGNQSNGRANLFYTP